MVTRRTRKKKIAKKSEKTEIDKKEITPRTDFKCAGCSKLHTEKHPLYICVKCKNIHYCGKACQTNDWKQHKLICNEAASKLKSNEKLKVKIENKILSESDSDSSSSRKG